MPPVAFRSSAAFRRWLERHHATATEVVVACAKKGAGVTGVRYPDALDEALCFGWIDGITRRIDDARYAVRFTPRRPRSHWSAVNLKRYAELDAMGRVAPPGRARYEARDPGSQPPLLVREPAFAAVARLHARVQGRCRRVVVLLGPAARLSPHRDLLGDERGEGGDAGAAARDPDPRFGSGTTARDARTGRQARSRGLSPHGAAPAAPVRLAPRPGLRLGCGHERRARHHPRRRPRHAALPADAAALQAGGADRRQVPADRHPDQHLPPRGDPADLRPDAVQLGLAQPAHRADLPDGRRSRAASSRSSRPSRRPRTRTGSRARPTRCGRPRATSRGTRRTTT